MTAFGKFAKGAEGQRSCGRVGHPAGLLSFDPLPLHFTDAAGDEEWYRPVTLAQFQAVAKEVAANGKMLRPVCANTADGVIKYYAPSDHTSAGTASVDVSLITELQGASLNAAARTLTVGSTFTIKNTIDILSEHAAAYPAFGVLAEHMKRIASVQIRSVASWAGNVMLTRQVGVLPARARPCRRRAGFVPAWCWPRAPCLVCARPRADRSPVSFVPGRQYPTFASDMATILGAAGAVFNIMDAESGTAQALSITDLFASTKDVLLVSMELTAGPASSVFQTFKTSQRHVFAHAIVNFGGYVLVFLRRGREFLLF